jgi:hypothetical protein
MQVPTGTWNAALNIASNLDYPFKLSDYYTPADALYIVSTAGNTTLSGISEWKVGDFLWCDGDQWFRVENLADAIATPTTTGTIKPDNITTFVSPDGTLSAIGGGGGGVISVNGYTGIVVLTKADIGLSNVPNVDATNAGNISSGTLPIGRLSAQVTLAGNSFNGASQLVQTTVGGALPSLSSGATTVLNPATGTQTALNTALNSIYNKPIEIPFGYNPQYADYQVVESDYIVQVMASNLLILLPDATLVNPGRIYYINNDNVVNTVVSTNGLQDINGSFSGYAFNDPFNGGGFYSTGTNWRTI